MAFLRKNIFSSYFLKPAQPSSQEDMTAPTVTPFSVSLTSLLEALQIFGLSELTKPGNSWDRDAFTGAFSAQTLGVSGVCRIRYERNAPLTVTLEETGIRTTCELVTYEPSHLAEIPFARDELALKAIVGAAFLHDAIIEMAATNPTKLVISATSDALTFSSPNDHGAMAFQFRRENPNKDHQFSTADGTSHAASDPTVLETFMIADDSFRQAYKFAHIAATKRALASAIKVSIRGDTQGVLSLQFMIENEGEAGVSFVDFLFIPLVDEDEEDSMLGQGI